MKSYFCFSARLDTSLGSYTCRFFFAISIPSRRMVNHIRFEDMILRRITLKELSISYGRRACDLSVFDSILEAYNVALICYQDFKLAYRFDSDKFYAENPPDFRPT